MQGQEGVDVFGGATASDVPLTAAANAPILPSSASAPTPNAGSSFPFNSNEEPKPDEHGDNDSTEETVSWRLRHKEDDTIPIREIYRAFKYMNRTSELWNLAYYMVFFAIYLILIVRVFRVEPVYSMTRAIEDVFLDEEFSASIDGAPDDNGPFFKKNFYDIFSFEEYFEWVNGPLLKGIFNNEYYNERDYEPISVANIPGGFGGIKILSPIRFRTARVKKNTPECQRFALGALPDWITKISDCYPHFSEQNEAQEWDAGFEFRSSSRVRGVDGYGTHYLGGGYGHNGFFYELDLYHENRTMLTLEEARQRVKEDLMDKFWADSATRLLVVDFNVINFNLGNGMSVRFAYEISAGGGWHGYHRMYQVLLNSSSDVTQMALQSTFTILLSLYIVEFVKKLGRQRRKLKYLFATSWWTFVDFCNLILSIIVIVWMFVGQLNIFTNDLTAEITQRKTGVKFRDVFEEARILSYISYLASANVAFGFLKMFKFLRVYRRLTIMWDALAEALPEVVTLAIGYMILSGSFAIAGHILFGAWTEEFHSLSASLSTVLRSIMGDFNYVAIRNAEPIWAPVYYLLFVFLEFFVLLNMFIAVVNEYYEVAKKKLRQNTRDMESDKHLIVQSNLSVYWRQFKMRFLYACEQNKPMDRFKILCFGTPPDVKDSDYCRRDVGASDVKNAENATVSPASPSFNQMESNRSLNAKPRQVFQACPSNWIVVEYSPGVTRRDRKVWLQKSKGMQPSALQRLRKSRMNPWRTIWWWAVHHLAKRQRMLAITRTPNKNFKRRQRVFEKQVARTREYLKSLEQPRLESKFLPAWEAVHSKGDFKTARRQLVEKANKDRVRLLIYDLLRRAVDRHNRVYKQDLFELFDSCWERLSKGQRNTRLTESEVAQLLGVEQEPNAHDGVHREGTADKQDVEVGDVEHGKLLPGDQTKGFRHLLGSSWRTLCDKFWYLHKMYNRTCKHKYEYVEKGEDEEGSLGPMQDVIDLIRFTAELHDLHPPRPKPPEAEEKTRTIISDISKRVTKMESVLNEIAVQTRQRYYEAMHTARKEDYLKAEQQLNERKLVESDKNHESLGSIKT